MIRKYQYILKKNTHSTSTEGGLYVLFPKIPWLHACTAMADFLEAFVEQHLIWHSMDDDCCKEMKTDCAFVNDDDTRHLTLVRWDQAQVSPSNLEKQKTFNICTSCKNINTFNANLVVKANAKKGWWTISIKLDQTCKSIVRLHPCSPITVTGPPWAEEWRTYWWWWCDDGDDDDDGGGDDDDDFDDDGF